MYMKYRQFAEKKTGNLAPSRLIFFRGAMITQCLARIYSSYNTDGVSEGQFKQVLDSELKSLQGKCVS
jgi:eukaryotic translation initiation factor 2C